MHLGVHKASRRQASPYPHYYGMVALPEKEEISQRAACQEFEDVDPRFKGGLREEFR